VMVSNLFLSVPFFTPSQIFALVRNTRKTR
jgi:hypothetical protein